jgi:hypothetical protein
VTHAFRLWCLDISCLTLWWLSDNGYQPINNELTSAILEPNISIVEKIIMPRNNLDGRDYWFVVVSIIEAKEMHTYGTQLRKHTKPRTTI